MSHNNTRKRQPTRSSIGDLEASEFGNAGPRVIFLHGGPGVFGYMEPLCHAASEFCSAICYNQRGSKQTEADISISDHLRDLNRVVAHYSRESKPIIVGHSWGAMLGALFAGRFPSEIQKLILVGCGPMNRRHGEAFIEELYARFGNQREYFDTLWEAVENGKDPIRQQELANKYIQEIYPFYQNDSLTDPDRKAAHWDFRAAYVTMNEMDDLVSTGAYEKALHQIEVPLTVVQGTSDLVTPDAIFEVVRKQVPTASTIKLENGGHYPWEGSSRDEFLRVLQEQVRTETRLP